MTNRILYTNGQGEFAETVYDKPPVGEYEIEVRSVLTGVCRSDVDMMTGSFGPLPLNMSGHEGLGQVTAVGKGIYDIKIGDYVATRGEPAYADSYNVRINEFVRVPSAEPKYILEPVACGINIIQQPIREIAERSGPGKRLVILGSGFLAWVAYNTIKLLHLDFDITVVGHSNKDLWGSVLKDAAKVGHSNKELWSSVLKDTAEGTYDVVIDLSGNTNVFESDMVNAEALIVFGAQKMLTTDFSNVLWKACTVIFPSPRTKRFIQCMEDAAYWIEMGDLVVDSFWTKGYNRDTEWQNAFRDSLTRPENYSRGYIYWK